MKPMGAPFVLGLAASNRSDLSPSDEQLLSRRMVSYMSADKLSIHSLGEKSLSIFFSERYAALIDGLEAKYLTNSEIALVSVLFGAIATGAEVKLLTLKNYLYGNNASSFRAGLEELLDQADGIVLASPVYFGDRSSLVQQFVDLIHREPSLAVRLQGKVFTGASVGAKRNGGQETLLIYQLLDLLGFGVLGVGNDSESTSQYGGTCTGGDIGIVLKDAYGVLTCLGAGRRIGKLIHLLRAGRGRCLADRLRIGFFLLQDSNGNGRRQLEALIDEYTAVIEPYIFDLTTADIHPCLGCQYCPNTFGKFGDYCCAIRNKGDFFKCHHRALITLDALAPVTFSPLDKSNLRSHYQKFIERTRYLRRSDYLFSNLPLLPLSFEELGAGQHLHVRMITSFIRHESVVLSPIVGILDGGSLRNTEQVRCIFSKNLGSVVCITVGRLASAGKNIREGLYNPVGYAGEYSRDMDRKMLQHRMATLRQRQRWITEESMRRLIAFY